MCIFGWKLKLKKESINNSAVEHSSLGTFILNTNEKKLRLKSGGHGEENLQALKNLGYDYNIVAKYPNGVRLGNIPSHRNKQKRTGDWQVWFPKTWTRDTIKKAGEKTINSIPLKFPDGKNMFGTYDKVKVVVKRKNGKVATVFPYYKQKGVKQWIGKKEV